MTSPSTSPIAKVSRPVDREFFERELATFLPDKVFDAHCHIWLENEVGLSIPGVAGDIGADAYLSYMADIHSQRRTAAHFLGFASPDRPESSQRMNSFLSAQVAQSPAFRGAFFVRPGDDPEWVRQEVRRLKLHGLKCYHTFSSERPTWNADIPTYLPEPLVKVAHEEGWVIMLHMVKARAAADPENLYWIRRYCTKYPEMKLILAHSARGFQPSHNLEGLSQLRGLGNLYFDTSANCEPLAHQGILRIIGHDKLMYGSDFPISHLRGRSLAAADSFLWIYEDSPVWGAKHLRVDPVLVGLESLRSVKWACWSEKLSDGAIEDVFWNNAARLFGVAPEACPTVAEATE